MNEQLKRRNTRQSHRSRANDVPPSRLAEARSSTTIAPQTGGGTCGCGGAAV